VKIVRYEKRKIASGIEFYIVKSNRLWFWTNFSPWRVCPFLIICLTSIPAITFLAAYTDYNSSILDCCPIPIKLIF